MFCGHLLYHFNVGYLIGGISLQSSALQPDSCLGTFWRKGETTELAGILFFGIFLLEEAEFVTDLAPLHSRGTCSDAAVLLVPLQTRRLKQIKMN